MDRHTMHGFFNHRNYNLLVNEDSRKLFAKKETIRLDLQ